MADDRLAVRKTYKLAVGGEFVRSESGRSYPVLGPDDQLLAWAPKASRKDVRDAVRAARGAVGGWAGRTAFNRGQIIYRIAEMLEARIDQFAAELVQCGSKPKQAKAEVEASIDRLVWYAGWTDKLAHILGTVNPVAGPYFDATMPEPTGVVGVFAPSEPPLLGLVSRLAPVLAAGNVGVVVLSERWPLPGLSLAEVLATSDVPGGVVNLLSGSAAELAPWLAGHGDVDALDACGLDPELLVTVEVEAAEHVTRVLRGNEADRDWWSPRSQSPWIISAGMEMKTIWHPMGV
jgi:acyl-CoA reductase-like NAD-dependent aldehyde dehydrogenase